MTTIQELTVHNVSIQTATITIQTMVIGKRQVTLSVFRQLPEADYLDNETGEANGTAWGTVNYYWGDQDRDDIHVVWQDGERLCRDLVPQNWRNSSARDIAIDRLETAQLRIADAGNAILIAGLLCGDRFALEGEGVSGHGYRVKVGDEHIYVTLRDSYPYRLDTTVMTANRDLDPDVWWRKPQYVRDDHDGINIPAVRAETDDECAARVEQRVQDIQQSLIELSEECIERISNAGYDGDPASLMRMLSWTIRCMRGVEAENKAVKAAYERHVRELQALDQLFIAV